MPTKSVPAEPRELSTVAGDVAHDLGQLARQQVAVFQAEVRQELRKVGTGAAAVAAGGGLTVAGGLMGGIMLAHVTQRVTGLPLWVGYGVVTGLLGAAGMGLLRYGRDELAGVKPLPVTTESLAENLTWLRQKTTPAG